MSIILKTLSHVVCGNMYAMATEVATSRLSPNYEFKYNFSKTFIFDSHSNAAKVLRFNPIVVAEWMFDLLHHGLVRGIDQLAVVVGRSKEQVGENIRLLKIPVQSRKRLRLDPAVTEAGGTMVDVCRGQGVS